MLKIWKIPAIFLLSAIFEVPEPGFAQNVSEPERVFQAMVATLARDSVEATLVYFADDAFIQEVTPFTAKNITTYNSKQEIQQWLQKLLDFHATAAPIGATSVNGNTFSFLSKVTSDELKKASIDFIQVTQEITVAGGKIKSYILTPTSVSTPALQKAGYVGGASTQGQGGAVAPSGVPASGFGAGSVSKDGLTLPLVLVGLVGVCCVSLWLLRRRVKR